ncbi:MAG TPA: hypothetical protein ENH82_09975, partial [bacterium]|nr:hypothetical protein [bacterium]
MKIIMDMPFAIYVINIIFQWEGMMNKVYLDALVAEHVFGEPEPKVPAEPHGFDMFDGDYSDKGCWVLHHNYEER